MQLLLIYKRQAANQSNVTTHTDKVKIVQENPFTRVMELWETPDGSTIHQNSNIRFNYHRGLTKT